MKVLARKTLTLMGVTLWSLLSISANANTLTQQLKHIESATHGRLGVMMIDTASSQTIAYHADERFPMGCTSKLIAVAAALKQSMSDPTLLSQHHSYTREDVTHAEWSPVTKQHLAEGMSTQAMCQAAITHSDNLAMNLVIEAIGGKDRVNQFAQQLGNTSFRMDRLYPEEASATPEDLRDTATPRDMAMSVQQLVFGNTLAKPQKAILVRWLKDCETGNQRIRAGTPTGWVVADKTGSGDYGTTNDIAVIWPKHGDPIIVAVYFTQHDKTALPRNDVIAQVTKTLLATRNKATPHA